MLDSLAEIAVTFGPAVLALLGIVVSIIPNIARRREKRWFVLGFLALGSIVSASSWYELHSSNALQQDIWEKTTGGDNYAYLDMSKYDPLRQTVVLINPGKTPVYNLEFSILEVEDKNGIHQFPSPASSLSFDVVLPGEKVLDTKLMGSAYYINIEARNGSFFEEVRIDRVTHKSRFVIARIVTNENNKGSLDKNVKLLKQD